MRRLLPFLVLVLAAAACSSGEPDIAPPVGADAATTAALPASTAAPGPASTTTAATTSVDVDTAPALDYPPPDDAEFVVLENITDGDSFDVIVDGQFETVRLIGMNANEGTECFGPEGRDALIALTTGTEVTLEVIDGRDDFGRLLAYVWADERLVNAELVAGGFALARAISDHPLERAFEELEQLARSEGRGLWAPDACGTPSQDSIEIIDLLANAPGPDDENPNGEWILIENTGDSEVDLSGWTIKDESTRHRFEFPAGAGLDPGASAVVYSGCGSDSGGEFYWCSDGGSIWTNSGDTGFLLDPAGNIVDTWAYSG